MPSWSEVTVEPAPRDLHVRLIEMETDDPDGPLGTETRQFLELSDPDQADAWLLSTKTVNTGGWR